MNLKIKKDYLIYILCMLPYLESAWFGGRTEINNFFRIAKGVVFIYILIKGIVEKKITNTGYLLIIYSLVLIFTTIFHSGSISDSITESMALITPFLIVQYFIDKLTIKQIAMPVIVVISFYSITTLFQLVQFPFKIFKVHGLRDNYADVLSNEYGSIFLLGDIKRFLYFLFPYLSIVLIKNINDIKSIKGIKKNLIPLFLCVIILIYTWNVSGLFTLILLFICFINIDTKIMAIMTKEKNMYVIFLIIMFVNYFLINGQLITLFAPIFELFGKSPTLSGRVYIWEIGLIYIKSNPFLGNGLNYSLIAERIWGFVHMHNMFMNILYNGGIVLLFIYIVFNLSVIKEIGKCKNQRLKNILFITLLCFQLISLTDSTDNNMMFLILSLGGVSSKIKYN